MLSYSLFAINVRFQRLSTIFKFDNAKLGLEKSLRRLDAEEVAYFGGRRKVDTILNFISDEPWGSTMPENNLPQLRDLFTRF